MKDYIVSRHSDGYILGSSEAFNSINSLAINFLKQESWKQGAETGEFESENFAFGMPMEE